MAMYNMVNELKGREKQIFNRKGKSDYIFIVFI